MINLFFVSTLGGLYMAQSVIYQENFTNNHLIVLYENAESNVYEKIISNVDDTLFSSVESERLPPAIWHMTPSKAQETYALYESILHRYKPEAIFINSYNWHYNFIYDLSKNFDTKICLYEEGLSTYRLLICEHAAELHTVWESFKLAFRPFKPLRIFSAIFPYHTRLKVKSLFYKKKYKSVFSCATDFDELYVVFPEKASKVFNAGIIRKLHLDYRLNENMKNISPTINFTPSDIIYLDQTFGLPHDIHTEAIFSFFALHGKELINNHQTLYIKLHPKADINTKNAFLNKLNNIPFDVKLLDFGSIDLPVEYFISEGLIENIWGICSTTLVYSTELSPKVNVVSLAKHYKEFAIAHNISPDKIHNIAFHLAHLELFENIKIL